MKISDDEIKAAIDAWFEGATPYRDFTKDMRATIKAALRVRKKRKRERKAVSPMAGPKPSKPVRI